MLKSFMNVKIINIFDQIDGDIEGTNREMVIKMH